MECELSPGAETIKEGGGARGHGGTEGIFAVLFFLGGCKCKRRKFK